MTEAGFTSIYTTYDKEMAVALISALRQGSIKLIYRTSTETGSEDVLYEVCVPEEQVNVAHEILFNINTDNQE